MRKWKLQMTRIINLLNYIYFLKIMYNDINGLNLNSIEMYINIKDKG